MNITREEVLKIADISKIAVQDDEVEGLRNQLQDVLSYAERVTKLAGELPDQQSNKNINFFRKDESTSSLSKEVLSRAPEHEGDFFVVPKILDTK